MLQRCSAATLSDVCLRLRPFFAARGDVIIHAASEPDGIYLIRSGLCEVSRGGRVLKRLRPGDVFGENCLVEPSTCQEPLRVHTVVALEPMEMRRIFLEDLEILISNHIDMTLTHNLADWPAARKGILERLCVNPKP